MRAPIFGLLCFISVLSGCQASTLTIPKVNMSSYEVNSNLGDNNVTNGKGKIGRQAIIIPPATTTKTTSTTTTTTTNCPSGWKEYNSNCYFFNDRQLTWFEAEKNCIGVGGHLASIHSQAEQTFIFNNIGPSISFIWLGATDAVKEGTWIYTDGTPFDYKNWLPNVEPNGGTSENCLDQYGPANIPTLYWNDNNCNRLQPFICKKPTAPATSTSTTTTRATTTTTASTPISCTPASNTIYVQGATISGISLANCQSACLANPNCNFYTWNTGTQGCGIRTFPIGGVLDAPTQVTGSPTSTVAFNNVTFVSKIIRQSSVPFCSQACQSDFLCQSWSWYSSGSLALVCLLNYESPDVALVIPGPTILTSGKRSCIVSYGCG